LGWRVRPTAAPNFNDRRAYFLYVFARLKANAGVEETAANITGLFDGLLNEFDAPLNKNMPPDLMQQFLHQQITLNPGARGFTTIQDSAGQALTLLLGLTTLVLLIVCVNIANLLLVRGASRASEMAIRTSIGASRHHLMSQLLTE